MLKLKIMYDNNQTQLHMKYKEIKRKVLSLNGNKSVVSLCFVNSFRLSIVQQEKEMTDNILTVVSLHILYLDLVETFNDRLEIYSLRLSLILINMSETFLHARFI